jgi:hypothetical protein
VKKAFGFIALLCFVGLYSCRKQEQVLPPTNVGDGKDIKEWFSRNYPRGLPYPGGSDSVIITARTNGAFVQPQWTKAESQQFLLRVPLGEAFNSLIKKWIIREVLFRKDSRGNIQSVICELRVDSAYLHMKKMQKNNAYSLVKPYLDDYDFTGDVLLYSLSNKFLGGRRYNNRIHINDVEFSADVMSNQAATTNGGSGGGWKWLDDVFVEPSKDNSGFDGWVSDKGGFGDYDYSNMGQGASDYIEIPIISGDKMGEEVTTKEVTPEMIIDLDGGNDENKIVDMKKFFSCFNTIPDNGAKYSMSICVRLPDTQNPNRPNSGLTPGHVFITLEKANGTSTVNETFGFFPDVEWKALVSGNVESQTNDNGGSKYSASMKMDNISESDFKSIQTYAAFLSKTKDYNLGEYNCTHYALQIFNSIRPDPLVVPDWISVEHNNGNLGTIPNGLYKALAGMKDSPGVSVGSFVAPASLKCQ